MLLKNVEENLNIKFYSNDVSVFQINQNVQYTVNKNLNKIIFKHHSNFTERTIRYEQQRKYET